MHSLWRLHKSCGLNSPGSRPLCPTPQDSTEPTSEDTLMFRLKVKCTRNNITTDATDPDVLYKHHKVYTSDMEWVPLPGQDHLKCKGLRPVDKNILITPLRPGQIHLLREFHGEQAKKLQECFSPGVIDLIEKPDGRKVAVVADARKDTCSRNVFRHEDLKDGVSLSRVIDDFIFSVESTGILPPDVLVSEAIKILMGKSDKFLQELEETTSHTTKQKKCKKL